MIRSFLRFIFKIDEYESRLLEGIKANERVEVYCSYYDNPSHHNIIWEDIFNVYHLAKEGSEESIMKLQKEYRMEDKGYSIYVSLRAPITYGTYNDDLYYSFNLDTVKSYYNEVLTKRDEQIKREKEKIEREMELVRKNETKNLKEAVNKIMNK